MGEINIGGRIATVQHTDSDRADLIEEPANITIQLPLIHPNELAAIRARNLHTYKRYYRFYS